MHTLKGFDVDVGREGLCKLLSAMLARSRGADRGLCVIFDGPAPYGSLARPIAAAGVQVRYSGLRRADDLLLEAIAASTAPRRLRVVSSDRQIRAAARRRRCREITSQDFAQELLKTLERPLPPPPEPPEKRAGSTPQQTRQWLREFGIDPGGRPDPIS